MVRGGAGASTTRSHRVQANFGRTWRITLKLAGMYLQYLGYILAEVTQYTHHVEP